MKRLKIFQRKHDYCLIAITSDNHGVVVVTNLIHSSGEVFSSCGVRNSCHMDNILHSDNAYVKRLIFLPIVRDDLPGTAGTSDAAKPSIQSDSGGELGRLAR